MSGEWKADKMAEETSFKFDCPHCGQRIEADADMVGMTVDCPACGQSFDVPHIETARPAPPVIAVIRKRERFVDRCKKKLKAVGTGVVVLLLFVGVGVLTEFLGDEDAVSTEGPMARTNNRAKSKAVLESIECLLNFLRRPNDRRSQALCRSLESCPNDFQDAVRKYLDSTRKSINDFMPEVNEDPAEELERELYHTIRRGSPVDLDPRLAGLKGLAVAEAAKQVERRRASRIESAKQRLKEEVDNATKLLIDVAEKYGIDPISLEDALLD